MRLLGSRVRHWMRSHPLNRRLSPGHYVSVIRRLEREGAPDELNLDAPSWRSDSLRQHCVTVEATRDISIPAAGEYLAEESFVWPSLQVRELRNVQVDIDSGLLFAEDRVIGQSGGGVRWSRDAAFITGAFVRVRAAQPMSRAASIAVLGDTHHHYHFIIETLPRVLHIKRTFPEARFVTSQEVGPFARGVFDQLGIGIEKLEAGHVLQPEKAILCDHPIRFWPRHSDLLAIRDALIDSGAGKQVESSEVVYVSRSRSSRSLRSEHLLENAVANVGVRVVFLEEIPLREQVRMFAMTRLVIGPHGAGLSNIAFMQPGSRVVEISSGDGWEPCYRRMAAIMGLEYVFLPAPGDAESPYGSATPAFIDSVLSIVKSDSIEAHSH